MLGYFTYKQNWGLPYLGSEEMTYIIAGNLNGINFITVDCVATTEIKSKTKSTFDEKLFLLNSCKEETYTTLSGYGLIMDIIRGYDDLMKSQGVVVDYSDNFTIKTILENFINSKYYKNSNVNFVGETIIYFVSNSSVFYQIIKISSNNKNITTTKKDITINTFVNNTYDEYDLNADMNKVINTNGLFQFTKGEIIRMNGDLVKNNNRIFKKIIFKNRFSHIKFENNQSKFIRPFKDYNDYLDTKYSKNYDDIQDNK